MLEKTLPILVAFVAVSVIVLLALYRLWVARRPFAALSNSPAQ